LKQMTDDLTSELRFPEEHWRRIRTNNPLERILREIRRRPRVVGRIPGRPVRAKPRCGQAEGFPQVLQSRASNEPNGF
jgi:hypothetical protein